MSFDLYFQRFRDGRAVAGGGSEMRAVLRPFVTREDPTCAYACVEYGDGSFDVYLADDDLMVNHVVGEQPWQLLVEGARAADWVIMPADGPTCLTAEAQRAHLTDDLSQAVVLVDDGRDLLRAVRGT